MQVSSSSSKGSYGSNQGLLVHPPIALEQALRQRPCARKKPAHGLPTRPVKARCALKTIVEC